MAKIKQRNVVVEIPLPDGWLSMYIGRLVRRDSTEIVLDDVSWISSTGRRNEFFAGKPDVNCEIEPYPDGSKMSLPAPGAIVTDWPHPLPRSVR